MKTKGFIAILIITIVAFVVYSVSKTKRFTPAADLPREALVYVQIADLPAFIKLWKESKFKEKYSASKGFENFKNRHLALKLAKRWEEFNSASGFPIDLETVAGLANNQAAAAIYDIGKLDFVFIAPISEQIFAATKFIQNQDKFTKETLDNGTEIFRSAIEADRGRQKQELIFTNVKGRLIIATSEKLLVQTLNNINGNRGKNSLIDEPLFKDLSEKITPHLATVWVNQTLVNDNYYFKRYWLMSDVKNLKNIRAGIFDFEMTKGNLIERRKFMLSENINSAPIEKAQAEKMINFLPGNIPFYQLQKAAPLQIDRAIRNIISDRSENPAEVSVSRKSNYSVDDDNDSSSNNYSSLGDNFDQNIDAAEDEDTIEKPKQKINFSKILEAANPESVLTFTQPEILPAPKFIEFKRAAIFYFSAPNSFNRTDFESAIEQEVSAKILISSPGTQLKWSAKNENGIALRELNLPTLGWGFSYAVRGNNLILTNSSAFLQKIVSAKTPLQKLEPQSSFSELAVINLAQKENAYDKVFAEFAKRKAANDFFATDVKSFLDSIDEVKKIEIKRNYSQNILDEELIAEFVKQK